jgi:hypothetical protein
MTAGSPELRVSGPFPFIIGVGRSGTTLLRAILDTHPDMAIPGESHFIPVMVKDRRQYESLRGFRTDRFLEDLGRYHWFRRWELPMERVTASLQLEPPMTLAAAIRRLYQLYAQKQGKARYGDKTPAYVHHMPTLAVLFPEARFVHLVRDGRDVALSTLDHPTMSKTPPELAIFWRRGVEKGRRAGGRLGSERYCEVLYENLVTDPEAVARSVCDFLELRFDPLMLRYHERASEIVRSTPHPRSHSRVHLPPTKGLRDWRSQMSRKDVALFDVLAGELLQDLGYERARDRHSLGEWVSAHGKQLSVESRRVARAVRKRLRLRPPQGAVSD